MVLTLGHAHHKRNKGPLALRGNANNDNKSMDRETLGGLEQKQEALTV